jgi:hypothetical protein
MNTAGGKPGKARTGISWDKCNETIDKQDGNGWDMTKF